MTGRVSNLWKALHYSCENFILGGSVTPENWPIKENQSVYVRDKLCL